MNPNEMTHMVCCNVVFPVEELLETFVANSNDPLCFANELFRKIDTPRMSKLFDGVGWEDDQC